MNSTHRPLWQWAELCQACGIPTRQGPNVAGISIDSRTTRDGELFIALAGDPGPRFSSSGSGGRDGHDFVAAALGAGAAGIMVSRDDWPAAPALVVPDTLDGLWDLGRAARRRATAARIVGVTGSAGKTTARQWLGELLPAFGHTHTSTGSLNNHWGVPLSLARMPAETELGVFEIGTNHPGEIRPLSTLVAPHVSVLLNVLPAHIGFFESMDALRQEKLSIAAGLQDGGTLVVPFGLNLAGVAPARIRTFGFDPAADVSGSIEYHGSGSLIRLTLPRGSFEFELNQEGEHRAATCLAVIAVLEALDLDVERVLPLFASLSTPAGRGNRIRVGNVRIVDDSYNANPVSVRLALEALGREQGRRIAVLGEMLELGGESAMMHAGIARYCQGLDGVVTVGQGYADWPQTLGSRYWGHFEQASDINLAWLAGEIGADATVLVKGSNKVFWTTGFVERLTRALDDGH